MHGAGAISVASCICRMLSLMSPNRPGHKGSNGLLMQEPKLNPDNHVWRHMWANAGLFLVRRAALQRGAPAVYTKTARERSDKRRPPTIDVHHDLSGRWKIQQPRHHRRNPQASGPAMGSQRPTGLYVAFVAPINPQELLPAVHGKAGQPDACSKALRPILSTQGRSHRLWRVRDRSVTVRRTE